MDRRRLKQEPKNAKGRRRADMDGRGAVRSKDGKLSVRSVNVRNDSNMQDAKPRIPPLLDPVILYVNKGRESKRAKTLLEYVGIEPFITDGPVRQLQKKPLALWCGGVYQGLDKIRGLISFLESWSTKDIKLERPLFKNS